MECASCGTEAAEGSTHCTNCGAKLQTDVATETSSSDGEAGKLQAASGCLVLLFSIFTMPIKTANMAAHELRQIAKAGALETDKDFPHLFWCKAMLPIVATALSALVFLGVLVFAVITGGIVGLIVGLVPASLALVFTDWFIMIVGEYLVIKVVSGRYYTQKIKEADKESG